MASIGYAWLIERLELPVVPLQRPASVTGRVNRRVDAENQIMFPTGVSIKDTPVGHLEFALRHEGVNLEVIEASFERISPDDLIGRLRATPNGEAIRRACFLWEWLTGQDLPTDITPRGSYVDLFPADEYVTAAEPLRAPKYRVRDNALGTRDFCPIVRLAAIPQAPGLPDLLAEAGHLLGEVADPDLYERALNYLYLSETRGSYAIEQETPSADKQARFVRLLRKAGGTVAVDEAWLVALQNAVVRDVYSQEASYRTRQNWLEDGTGLITFFPPPPEELRRVMDGWEAFVKDETRCLDVLIKTACAAFGFVYLHPFMDGNGRLHRFLIHHLLAGSKQLAPGTIVPVSAVISKNIPAYLDVLTGFSRPVTSLWNYQRGGFEPAIMHSPGSRPYRFFDFGHEVAFLHRMICQAVREEIPRELAWLRGYDLAFARLDRDIDIPRKDLAALIRMAQSSQGNLSLNRRKQYAHLPEEVLNHIEAVVQASFGWKNPKDIEL